MSDFFANGFEPRHLVALAAIAGVLAAIAGVVAMVIISKIADMRKAHQREQTRREIAAYVAEGSMDADQADRLLGLEQTEAERKLTEAVAWGMISSAKAERLIRALREQRGEAAPAADQQPA